MTLFLCWGWICDFLRIEDRAVISSCSPLARQFLTSRGSVTMYSGADNIANAPLFLSHMSNHTRVISCHGQGNVFVTSLIKHLPFGMTILRIPHMAQRITDEDISLLPRTLTWLDMANNKILTNGAISGLPQSLTHLNWASVARVNDLRHFPSTLQTLIIECCPFLSHGLVTHEENNTVCYSLVTKVDLARNASFDVLRHVASPKLVSLSLFHNKYVTDNDTLWLQHCTRLTRLNLANAVLLSDTTMFNLPETLLHLDIGNNGEITDHGIGGLPRALQYLNVSCGKKITDRGMPLLPPGLKHLDMARNRRITNEGVRLMPKSLTYLNLIYNKNVSRRVAVSCLYFLKTLHVLSSNDGKDSICATQASISRHSLSNDTPHTHDSVSLNNRPSPPSFVYPPTALSTVRSATTLDMMHVIGSLFAICDTMRPTPTPETCKITLGFALMECLTLGSQPEQHTESNLTCATTSMYDPVVD